MPQQFPALGLPANNQAQPEPDLLGDLISQQQGRLTGLENQGEDPRIAQLMEAVQASQQPVGLNTPEKILTALNSVAFLADRFSKKPRGRSAPQKFAQNLQGIQAGPQGRKQAQQQKLQSELFIQDFLKDIAAGKDAKRGRITDRLAGAVGTKARIDAGKKARDEAKQPSPKEIAEAKAKEAAYNLSQDFTNTDGRIEYENMDDHQLQVMVDGGYNPPDYNAAKVANRAAAKKKADDQYLKLIQENAGWETPEEKEVYDKYVERWQGVYDNELYVPPGPEDDDDDVDLGLLGGGVDRNEFGGLGGLEQISENRMLVQDQTGTQRNPTLVRTDEPQVQDQVQDQGTQGFINQVLQGLESINPLSGTTDEDRTEAAKRRSGVAKFFKDLIDKLPESRSYRDRRRDEAPETRRRTSSSAKSDPLDVAALTDLLKSLSTDAPQTQRRTSPSTLNEAEIRRHLEEILTNLGVTRR